MTDFTGVETDIQALIAAAVNAQAASDAANNAQMLAAQKAADAAQELADRAGDQQTIADLEAQIHGVDPLPAQVLYGATAPTNDNKKTYINAVSDILAGGYPTLGVGTKFFGSSWKDTFSRPVAYRYWNIAKVRDPLYVATFAPSGFSAADYRTQCEAEIKAHGSVRTAYYNEDQMKITPSQFGDVVHQMDAVRAASPVSDKWTIETADMSYQDVFKPTKGRTSVDFLNACKRSDGTLIINRFGNDVYWNKQPGYPARAAWTALLTYCQGVATEFQIPWTIPELGLDGSEGGDYEWAIEELDKLAYHSILNPYGLYNAVYWEDDMPSKWSLIGTPGLAAMVAKINASVN